jgi:molybdopterin molybdotransferase
MARIGKQILIGLPGNPQSAVIGLLTLAVPLISGANGKPLPDLELRTIASDMNGAHREARLLLCTQEAGVIKPIEYLDSSMLRGFVSATGYAVLPPGGAKSGEQVQWITLP